MVEELNNDNGLLKYLANNERGNKNRDEWKKEDQLVKLITLYDQRNPMVKKEDYSLEKINILTLLRTSTFYRNPAARRSPGTTTTTTQRPTSSESSNGDLESAE